MSDPNKIKSNRKNKNKNKNKNKIKNRFLKKPQNLFDDEEILGLFAFTNYVFSVAPRSLQECTSDLCTFLVG